MEPNTQQNPTINADQPITGGETQLIINDLQVRQVIRQKADITSYLSAITAAESRYYPNRTQLYDKYVHCLLDGHLFGIIEKRIGSVLNKPLFYKEKNGEVCDDLTPLIQSYEFRQIIRGILESVLYGITGLEFIPGKNLEVRQLPRKHIKTKTQIIATEQNQLNEGISYTGLDNVWIIGEDEDLGILLPACLYAIYKRNAIADWANFLQIFGIPMRVARYEVNDKVTQVALKQALDQSGSALSMLIPKSADFTIEDGKTANANGDLQVQFVDKMDQFMSIIILGNTETTTNGKTGSQAKSKVHQEQQDQILKSDMALVTAYLNDPHFTKILQSYGIPVTEDGNFEFNKDVDIAFLTARSEVDKNLVAAGVPIGVKYFYETYNIPKPGPNEPLVGQQKALASGSPDGAQSVSDGQSPSPTPPESQTPDLADLAKMIIKQLGDTNFFA